MLRVNKLRNSWNTRQELSPLERCLCKRATASTGHQQMATVGKDVKSYRELTCSVGAHKQRQTHLLDPRGPRRSACANSGGDERPTGGVPTAGAGGGGSGGAAIGRGGPGGLKKSWLREKERSLTGLLEGSNLGIIVWIAPLWTFAS